MSFFSEEQMAGQRLMVGFNGTEFHYELAQLIGDLQVGGLILFSRNIESIGQLSALCQSVQSYSKTCGLPPLFIAIDQEGGTVARLKAPFSVFPGNPFIRNHEDAEGFACVSAWELAMMGINMNMAPVMDVADKGMTGIMAKRAFSDDPDQVSGLGCTIINGLQKHRIMAVAKHFPGIGRTRIDSHIELPVFYADRQSLESLELIPFRAAIEQGVSGIMLSHILYPDLDSQCPASLSSRIALDLLRREMGYEGLVITDDLDMGAVAEHFDIRTSVSRRLEADIDVVLICHKGPNIRIAHEEILRQIRANPDMKKRCAISVDRILEMKKHYCP
jgi:beta-N-acetylhexosaminidase